MPRLLKSSSYRLWLLLLLSAGLLGVFVTLHHPSERVIVHFAPDSTLAEREAWSVTQEIELAIPALDAVVIRTGQALSTLEQHAVVGIAEYDAPLTLLQDDDTDNPLDALSEPMRPAPPPDPLYAQQWNIQAIHAPDAWMRLPRQHDISVAIIDSGICAEHDEFSGVQITGYDFVEQDAYPQDKHGHGCGVAGIIGATRQNGIGIAGLLNEAHLMALRVADGAGEGYASNIAAALVYATDNSAEVINMSLGTPEDTLLMRRAVSYAGEIPMVAAAGDAIYYPAGYETVLAVGSRNQAGQAIDSNGADVYAPGVDVLTTGLDNQIVTMSGTSVASAHMAGMVALDLLTADEMRVDGTLAEMVADMPVQRLAGAREVKVFVVVYESSIPLYDPLKLNDLTLLDMTRSSIAHGYDNPNGQPAVEYVLADEPVVINGAPPAPDPNYRADYNYAAIYEDFDLCARIQAHEVDEVWLWGEANPDFGNGLEWVTNGPELQWTWGSNVPDCGRTITTMWFEYNREVALALHSYGHRMEGAFMLRTPCQFMTATYPWAGEQWLTDEDHGRDCDDSLSDTTGFVARTHANNGNVSACGDVHSPPNILPGTGAYQYSETNQVASMCEDWQRDGTGTYQVFGCERWNCNERDYQIWWKQNIPALGYEHRDSDGSILPNWWDYLWDMEN
ncbi:MAG: S8 family serine peptidase [Chloroflexota bacterium]